jgi:hypothetical protein
MKQEEEDDVMDREEPATKSFACLPKIAEEFHILEHADNLWRKQVEFENHLKEFETARLFPNAKDGSKMKFCADLKDILVRYQVPEAEKELIELLHRNYLVDSGVDIPYGEVRYSTTSESIRGHKSSLSDFWYLKLDAASMKDL